MSETIDKIRTARAITKVAELNKAGQEAIVQHLDEAIAILEKEPDLQEQIKRLKDENRWIPVSERLPEEDVDCLCFEGRFAGLGNYQLNSDTLKMQWQVNGYVSKRVTHWKLIVLPEQATKEK